ncbi:MAG: nicotinate-nucleotide adenylyltransferase [Chromatiales bacterium]|nr:nicotinate-nucleotide adenylyltransferase [Chromatiales bacterium]
MSPIGVFGGTFDPVHVGHLRPALELQQQLGLQRVHFIPCHIPPHRGEPHATAEQRCEMLRLAIEKEPGFVLDRRELERDGPSYMVETLKSLRAEYGGQRPLFLLIGGDAFLGLPDWYHWQEIIGLAHIVVAHRPGWRVAGEALPLPLRELLAQHPIREAGQLASAPAGGVWLQTVTPFDISATAIRRMIEGGESANFLLPQPVWDYIRHQNLYRSE